MPTFTTGQIAQHLGGTLHGPGGIAIDALDTLEHARDGSLTFIRTTAYAAKWAKSAASATLISQNVPPPEFDRARKAMIVVPDADLALIKVLQLFTPKPSCPAIGVHPTAVIDPSASVDPSARIGPFCLIGAGARVGAAVVLHSHVVVGDGAVIGERTELHTHVSIGDRCRVGRDCLLHPGVVIGADGFGFRPSPDGRGVVKIPHIGDVVIGDLVEIGANSCVDRGKLGSTTIGDGTKIDNLVQIAHNCQIGRACLIAGQTGIAGSTVVGDGCIFAGQVGVVDNVVIGPNARIGANSGVTGHLKGNDVYFGYPAARLLEMRRVVAAWHKLPDLLTRVRELEKLAGVKRKSRHECNGEVGADGGAS